MHAVGVVRDLDQRFSESDLRGDPIGVLGDAAFEAAYARGRTLSQADAITLAIGAAGPDPG